MRDPRTPRARAALARAQDEARRFDDHCVGTAHILLGLLGESESVAARVLREIEPDSDVIREAVIRLLSERRDREEVAGTIESGAPALGDVSDDDLKARIIDLGETERALSYERRIVHAEIDIRRAELVTRLRRRHERGESIEP